MRNEPPDLLLLDLMMPELDGFGVIKAMQEDECLCNVPVVVLSGQVLTERDMARLNRGVATVLGKGLSAPRRHWIELERLYRAVNNWEVKPNGLFARLWHSSMNIILEPIQRSDIARHLNINEQYLTRCFDKEIGVSPMAYLNRFRIQHAKKMLEAENHTITQVALETGFSSQSYFSRMFQKEVGISPKAYQQGERSLPI